jgi:hypothetical protein
LKVPPFFLASLIGSFASCGAGWKLVQSQKKQEGESAFISMLSPRALLYYLGWLLLALGVFALFILTPMAYIAG